MDPIAGLPCCSVGINESEFKDRRHEATHLDEEGLLSVEDLKIVEYVNFVFISSLIGLFGIMANIINIFIFYKQGFTNTANIAFLGLAVSDLCCLITLEWTSICINPSLPEYDVTWVSVDIMYLSAGWPHVYFCRITSYITVYITAERFISIAWPMKVKQIVTPRRTILIICLIYIVNITTLIPEYATSYLDWKFVPKKNRTLVGIHFTSNRQEVEGLCYVLHALLSATSFFAVIFFTFALVIKLRQSSNWRKEASSDQSKREASSDKERKTVKMVVLIATVLIICYTPSAVISAATFIVGIELTISGSNCNLEEAMWSIAYCFQSVNSSINIFLYYKMSSKYRNTFNYVFLRRFRKIKD